jgi:ATP-dependent Clp protease ATP-binding subunit ClpA
MNTGVSPEFGARPVVQTIQKYIALAIIQTNKKSGILAANNNKLILY